MSTDVTGIGAWVAIITGAVGIVVAVYGAYQAWQGRRLERAARLNDAASVAVRKVEAVYARPIMQGRLDAVVRRWSHANETDADRMLLFCDLQREVRLDSVEKAEAQRRSVENLVDALRVMPSPPLRVRTAADVQRHEGRLCEVIEGAYQLRPRLSASVIREFAQFCPAPLHRHRTSAAPPDRPPPP